MRPGINNLGASDELDRSPILSVWDRGRSAWHVREGRHVGVERLRGRLSCVAFLRGNAVYCPIGDRIQPIRAELGHYPKFSYSQPPLDLGTCATGGWPRSAYIGSGSRTTESRSQFPQ